jgi:hypothetical protein
MLAGAEGTVWYSDDNGDSWSDAGKPPVTDMSGDDEDIWVVVADDYMDSGEAWASAEGNAGGVYFTTDYGDLWNGMSLLSTDWTTILDIEPAPDYADSGVVFAVTHVWDIFDPDSYEQLPPAGNLYDVMNNGYYRGTNLWKYDGENWEQVFHKYLMDADDYFEFITDVEVSPEWADDETVFFADWFNNRAYRARDGGNEFKRCHKQSVEPTGSWSTTALSWLVVDDSTRFVGYGDGRIYRTTNNGTTWSKKKDDADEAIISFALDPNNPDNIIAGDIEGYVWLSEDGGSDWDDVGQPEDDWDWPMALCFDPDYASNGYFYAALLEDGAPSVYRYSSWDDIDGITSTWVEDVGGTPSVGVEAGNGLVCGSNGILYVLDWTDYMGTDATGAARSINPTGATSKDEGVYFETMDAGFPDDASGWGLWLTEGESNTLWTIAGVWDEDDEEYDWDEVWTYTDTIYEGPTLSSPANNTSSLRVDEVTLKWDAIDDADEYYIFVSEDVGFADYYCFTSSTTGERIEGLRDGQSYYWKVCVQEEEPALSLWSSTWKFTTALSEAQWNPFVGGIPEAPYNGATDVPLTPSFAWNAADWATGYEFELADNPDFSPTIKSFMGVSALDTTVFLLDEALANSTTYYWRVRAVTSTTQSEWANAVFTTMAAPPAPPAPPPPPPTPPAPIVPAPPIPTYLLWTIIGVGAVLVIAVIILIIRTRARI